MRLSKKEIDMLVTKERIEKLSQKLMNLKKNKDEEYNINLGQNELSLIMNVLDKAHEDIATKK